MCNPAYPDTETTICLDFDGVIHNDNKGYHDGTVYGDPIEGAIEALKEISKHDKIVICSTKAREDRPLVDGEAGVVLIWNWLMKWELTCLGIEVTAAKPPAYLYVDDKNWPNGSRFDKEKWNNLLTVLRARWKKY